MNYRKIDKDNPVIAWWSGGVDSAIVCWLCILWFGIENVRIVFIDTKNEDEDTYRFLYDCEAWYGKPIEIVFNKKYKNIKEVWYKFLSLNVANGAICSTELKREVREEFQRNNSYSHHAFGFDINETDRAKAMSLNYPECYPIFPLVYMLLTKKDNLKLLADFGIKPPRAYEMGYHNNNCLKKGCVQGGIGYWQKFRIDNPEAFYEMAMVEHELTDLKGSPVTMLKDQSKGGGLVFLLPHPGYPHMKDISMMKGRPPKPLMECSGYCGLNDLSKKKNKTHNEINYQN